MNNVSVPAQHSIGIQTIKFQKEVECIPVPVKIVGGKKVYCYHGNKCKCPRCEEMKRKKLEELDASFEKFIPNDRLKLKRPIRLALPKQFTVPAKYVSPEFSKVLIDKHDKIREEIKIYYLPDEYYMRTNAYIHRGPQDVATQTDIPLGLIGIDGCPCVEKTNCFDI